MRNQNGTVMQIMSPTDTVRVIISVTHFYQLPPKAKGGGVGGESSHLGDHAESGSGARFKISS
jgi:hypothetical protein